MIVSDYKFWGAAYFRLEYQNVKDKVEGGQEEQRMRLRTAILCHYGAINISFKSCMISRNSQYIRCCHLKVSP